MFENQDIFKESQLMLFVFNLLSMLLISIHNFEIWLRKFV